MPTPPTSFAPGTSNIGTVPTGGVGANAVLDYISLLQDPYQRFQYNCGGINYYGLLENDPVFRWASNYTLTAVAEIAQNVGNGLAGAAGGAVNSNAIAGLMNNRMKSMTTLSWDSSDANYINLQLQFTLIAVYNAQADVLDQWLNLSQLVLPTGMEFFTAPMDGQTGILQIGNWIQIPNLYVKSLDTAMARMVMVDGKPLYGGVGMTLISKQAISIEDLRSYII